MGSIWGVLEGGWYPQTLSKCLPLKYLLISKNTGIVSLVVQKFGFWGSTLGGFPGGWHPQTMSKYLSVVSVGIEK